MSSVYTGNSDNNPTGITLPSDGDKANAASVNVPLEGLMDKVCHVLAGETQFTGTKEFNEAVIVRRGATILNEVGDDAPAILTDDAPIDRKLMWQANAGDGIYVRIYARKRDTGYEDAGYDITRNAFWDSGAWNPDDDTKEASIIEAFGGATSPTYGGQGCVTQLKRRDDTSTTWAEDEWDAGGLVLSPGHPAYNDAIIKGTLTPNQVTHAWGTVETDGLGNVSVTGGVGIASVTITTGDVIVTLQHAMQSGWAPKVQSGKRATPLAMGEVTSSTTFAIRWANTSHTQLSAASNALIAHFHVHGEQT